MEKALNKQDLIKAIVKKTGMHRKDVVTGLNGFLSVVKNALANKKEVRLIGFGNFGVRHRKARRGRNPQTGQAITIAARNAPVFKAGVPLKKLVNK